MGSSMLRHGFSTNGNDVKTTAPQIGFKKHLLRHSFNDLTDGIDVLLLPE